MVLGVRHHLSTNVNNLSATSRASILIAGLETLCLYLLRELSCTATRSKPFTKLTIICRKPTVVSFHNRGLLSDSDQPAL